MCVASISEYLGVDVKYCDHLFRTLGVDRTSLKDKYPRKKYRIDMPYDELYDMYINKEMPSNNIGIVFGCDGTNVLKRLRDYGIRIRHHNDTKKGKNAHNRIEIDDHAAINNYAKLYESVQSTADLMGVTRDVVKRVLDENNITIKKAGLCRDFNKENHPNWNPELTDEHREAGRDVVAQSRWREFIYEKDDYKCLKCGYSGNLNAHHIVGYAQDEELRWEISNGATLCNPCHVTFHSTYGIKRFGPDDLNEYLGYEYAK
jgi:hypothetical protein